MSAKRSSGGPERLVSSSDGRSVALTDHALDRWRRRTPATCMIGAAEAFRRGEPIKDPRIVFEEREDGIAEARVFKAADGDAEWTMVFLVVVDQDTTRLDLECNAELVVPTIYRVRAIEHGPTRAYLNSHGPHYVIGDEEGER